jgi:hypothetical protein
MDFAISPSPFLWLFPALLFGIPLVLWIGFASTLARRDAVDRPNRIAQWYGYSVCLVTVVTLLFSTVSIVNNAFRLANPLQSGEPWGPSLSSFAAYKATYNNSPYLDPTEREAARKAPPSEAELRQRYEALRAERTGRNRHEAGRGLVTSILLSLFAAGLFLMHWRWLRGFADAPPG